MHTQSVNVLRAAIAESYTTLSKLDYESPEAGNVLAQITGLKFAIALLK